MFKSSEPPRMARVTSNNVFVKDHHYYKTRDINWNNPAHVNQKIYSQFHRNADDKKPSVDNRKQQDVEQNMAIEDARRMYVLSMKAEDAIRYHRTKKERELIQDKCKQTTSNMNYLDELEPDSTVVELVAKRTETARHTRNNENGWNCLNKLSKKTFTNVITPKVIQGEEYMIESLKKTIDKERQKEEQEKQRIEEIRRNIKNTMNNQRNQNIKFNQDLGILSTRALESYRHLPSQSPSQNSTRHVVSGGTVGITTTIQSIATKRFESQGTETNRNPTPSGDPGSMYLSSNDIRMSKNSLDGMNRLASPKKLLEKSFNLADINLKGALVRNMEKGNFYSESGFRCALVAKSKVFEDVMKDSKASPRPQDSLIDDNTNEKSRISQLVIRNFPSREPQITIPEEQTERIVVEPPIVTLNYRQSAIPALCREENQARKELFDELDTFDRRLGGRDSKVGYPKVRLTEIKKPIKRVVKDTNKIIEILERVDEASEKMEP